MDWDVMLSDLEELVPSCQEAANLAARLAGGLNLPAGDALVVEALQTVVAKRDIVAARSVTAVFADTDFAVSNFFW